MAADLTRDEIEKLKWRIGYYRTELDRGDLEDGANLLETEALLSMLARRDRRVAALEAVAEFADHNDECEVAVDRLRAKRMNRPCDCGYDRARAALAAEGTGA